MRSKIYNPEAEFQNRQKQRGKALFLTSSERICLNVHVFPRLAHHARSVNYLLWSWESLVEKIEAGYENDSSEYMNSFSARVTLDEIVKVAPTSLKSKLIPILSRIDKRYRAATMKIDIPVYGRPNQYGWWDYRFPKIITAEVEPWAEYMGFITRPPSSIT